MTSGFSINELLKSASNYPVSKGDVLGHEFHGNQYSDGGLGGARALHSDTENFRFGMNKGEQYPGSENHREFAEKHDQLSKEAPTAELRQAHSEAADAHRVAADLHDTAEAQQNRGDTQTKADEASYKALNASNDVLSDHIAHLTR